MYNLIRIVYDSNCEFILDYIPDIIRVETYNLDHYKEKKKALPIMVRNGTKNVPLIVFVKNGIEDKVIWSEQNPDWEKEINKILYD